MLRSVGDAQHEPSAADLLDGTGGVEHLPRLVQGEDQVFQNQRGPRRQRREAAEKGPDIVVGSGRITRKQMVGQVAHPEGGEVHPLGVPGVGKLPVLPFRPGDKFRCGKQKPQSQVVLCEYVMESFVFHFHFSVCIHLPSVKAGSGKGTGGPCPHPRPGLRRNRNRSPRRAG